MNSYNERLDEVLNWHTKCREEIKVASKGFTDDRWAEEQYRKIVHKHKTKAKQDITSLIKELVAEAKPKEMDSFYEKPIVDEFEQNLLKALEER